MSEIGFSPHEKPEISGVAVSVLVSWVIVEYAKAQQEPILVIGIYGLPGIVAGGTAGYLSKQIGAHHARRAKAGRYAGAIAAFVTPFLAFFFLGMGELVLVAFGSVKFLFGLLIWTILGLVLGDITARIISVIAT